VLRELLLLGEPAHEEEYLGLKAEPGRVRIEIGEKGILLGTLEDEPRVQLLREQRGKARLPDADRAVDDDVAGIPCLVLLGQGVVPAVPSLTTA